MADGPASFRRRCALALLASAGVGLSCVRPDRRLRVPVAGLGATGRAVFDYAGEPVEVRRTPAGLRARSLLCSHYGCRVEWRPQSAQYVCPCHQGVFDEDGVPVAGPPIRPLRVLPVALSGDVALVGEP